MGTNWETPHFYKREFPFLDNVLSEEHVQIRVPLLDLSKPYFTLVFI